MTYITCFRPPGPDKYAMLKEVGINTVWGGDDRACDHAEAHLGCVSLMEDYALPPYQSVIGYSLGDDTPVSELPALEEKVQRISIGWEGLGREPICLVLVSATYTRMLDYLGVASIEEYYRAFAELAPSATPMLCHYPWHEPFTSPEDVVYDTVADLYPWSAYLSNVRMMHEVFGRNWWAWVQVSAHSHYDGDWDFYELGVDTKRQECGSEIKWQIAALLDHGCSGLGYFAWTPLEGDGIVDGEGNPSRHWDTIREINLSIAEEADP